MAGSEQYGVTPWGRWFAEALERFDENGRLSRGKSYANTGRVEKLDVERGAAVARVKGRSSPWYDVRIQFKPLSDDERDRVFRLIDDDPMLLARIEAGESPPELIDRLKAQEVELIPSTWTAMKRSCSCPDWGDPCKHQAAVYYMLAREIDRDPRLLFRLRGVDLAARFPERMYAGGQARSGPGSRSGARTERRLGTPFVLEFAGTPRTVSESGEEGPPQGAPEPPRFESYANFIISLLPARPSFAAGDFSLVLAEFYHRAARESEARESEAYGSPDAGAIGNLERRFSAAQFSVELEGAGVESSFPLAGGRRPLIHCRMPGGEVRALPLGAAAGLFLGFSDDDGSPGYRFLFHLFRHLRALRSACAFAPVPYLEGEKLRILWRPLPRAEDVAAALDDIARYEPGLLRPDKRSERRASGRSTVDLLSAAYFDEWVRGLGFRPMGEKAGERDLVELFFGQGETDARKPGERGLPGAIDAWLSVLRLDFRAYRYRFTIRAEGRGDDEQDDERAFSLGLAVMLPGGDGTAPKAVALKDAAKLADALDILRAPAALSSYLPEIRSLSTQKLIRLDQDRLALFLGEAAGLLSRLGAEVVLPKALRRALTPRLVVRAETKGSGSLRSYLDLETLLSYDWRVAIGDKLLDLKSFEKLVKSKKSVVIFRDGFVRLDPAEAARLLEKARSERPATALDLLAARLSGDASFSADAEEIVASLFRERELPAPAGLVAKLRPYQERGYRWACSNLLNGFGCILADDMGLGKTVQAIAVMLRLDEEGLLPAGALVVAPAALLTNWERELARFAPALAASRYHGPRRSLDRASRVYLTTYQTAVRDAEKLGERPFSLLVVDEAHLMKNSRTRQARTMKSLGAAYKLALSGTPVENRLEDLRSIFDFVLPGYLGGPADFKRDWRVPIEVERDREKAEALKRLTSPFLMRRLKTDRAIIDDLPDKVAIDEYATMSAQQAALYQGIVQKSMADAENAEPGPARSAIILRLLTTLKQVCDHPRVYDKESPPEAALSGKCGLLLALLEEALEAREKVLVFSQYVENLLLIKGIIGAELGDEPLLYHGGMTKKSRDAVVDAFQNEAGRRILLVSLRAGGLGLNLTAASRVIHYDLWFNPAVENQATDRAFRIGQTRNVFVHRFITTGTFEEKIDAMLKSKAELADMTVSTGEQWLTKMSDAQLREIFEGK